jgi:hypothetical protein
MNSKYEFYLGWWHHRSDSTLSYNGISFTSRREFIEAYMTSSRTPTEVIGDLFDNNK